jgi:hypothetical protein
MTADHTIVTTSSNINRNNPAYKMLENLTFDKQSIHNIRLKFEVPNLWSVLSNNPELHKLKRSKDILIPIHIQDTVDIKLSIHKTNTVTVSIACSLNPIRLDYYGIIKFYTLLARIEEQLKFYTLLEQIRAEVNLNSDAITIPDNRYWTIKMWHFGRDSLNEYSGDKFSITVEEAQGVLGRIYSKKINGKSRIRVETQEYPKKSVVDALNMQETQTEKDKLLLEN